jgi:hypothetical protein
MRRLALLLLFLPAIALAHDEAPPEHCVPIPQPLPEWKALHDEWWADVAIIQEIGKQYRECVQGINELRRVRGIGPIDGSVGVTGYVIPQHPLESQPNNVTFARDSVLAAEATIFQHGAELTSCNSALAAERNYADAHYGLYQRLWRLFLKLPARYRSQL